MPWIEAGQFGWDFIIHSRDGESLIQSDQCSCQGRH